MSNGKFWFKKTIGFIICGLAIAALIGWVVMSLWNCVLVEVINVKLITFWQALGLFMLGKILFGGFSKGCCHAGGKWNMDMKNKWQQMSPEEKEKFKQNWRNKCRSWKKNDADSTTGTE